MNSDCKLSCWLKCWIIAFTFLMLFSTDSYLHEIIYRADSAWFFTAGRAWMEGLVPYVDFADSKGPLLWFIYGVGYLISPHSFIGVFWISVFSYSIALYFCYKTTEFLVESRSLRWILTISTLFWIFAPFFHDEVRAEDFSQPFIFATLYQFCKAIKDENYRSSVGGFVIGLSIGATLLMKFTISAMFVVPLITMLVIAFRNKYGLKFLIYSIFGFAVIVVPFVVVLTLQGAYGEFIKQYFYATKSTYNLSLYMMLRTQVRCYYYWCMTPRISVLIAFVLSLLYVANLRKRYKWCAFVAVLAAFVSGTFHAIYYYYLSALGFLFLFANLEILKIFKSNHHRPGRYIIYVESGVLLICLVWAGLIKSRTIWYNAEEGKAAFDKISAIIASTPKARVMYQHHDLGFTIPGDGLPASKYWARQNGASQMMDSIRKLDLEGRKADFYIVMYPDEVPPQSMAFFGYRKILSTDYFKDSFHENIELYGKDNREVIRYRGDE